MIQFLCTWSFAIIQLKNVLDSMVVRTQVDYVVLGPHVVEAVTDYHTLFFQVYVGDKRLNWVSFSWTFLSSCFCDFGFYSNFPKYFISTLHRFVIMPWCLLSYVRLCLLTQNIFMYNLAAYGMEVVLVGSWRCLPFPWRKWLAFFSLLLASLSELLTSLQLCELYCPGVPFF